MAAVLLGPTNVYARTEASVVGTVTDESKAVLPGGTVTATELSMGRQYVAVTDERGQYRLVNAQPPQLPSQSFTLQTKTIQN